MLSVSPLPIPRNERQGEISAVGEGEFSAGCSEGNLFDDIDLGDLFVGIADGDVLPDLELDPEMFLEFSVEGSDYHTPPATEREEDESQKEERSSSQREESADQKEESTTNQSSTTKPKNPVSSNGHRGRKSATAPAKATQEKKKAKVDWTPDLHRRFVQAVEQLGLDKAVPSRILEIMGIDCLTRHNIASHLQKYRSHRKHLLAREAEAANWTQRRQMLSGPAASGSKRNMIMSSSITPCPWLSAPAMGFPSPHTHTAAMYSGAFRSSSSLSLHVWGHPTLEHHHLWPKHFPHSPHHPLWPPPPPHSYWQAPPLQHHGSKNGWVPNASAQGAPCFPRPMTAAWLPSPPVPGIPPHVFYNKADNLTAIPITAHLDSHFLSDFHPSEETIDAAVGDVLAKPMQPLPIGLKPPSLDSVLEELQRQGISKIPPPP